LCVRTLGVLGAEPAVYLAARGGRVLVVDRSAAESRLTAPLGFDDWVWGARASSLDRLSLLQSPASIPSTTSSTYVRAMQIRAVASTERVHRAIA
jgi:hypothetical protein